VRRFDSSRGHCRRTPLWDPGRSDDGGSGAIGKNARGAGGATCRVQKNGGAGAPRLEGSSDSAAVVAGESAAALPLMVLSRMRS
jgi:hypothetical protein